MKGLLKVLLILFTFFVTLSANALDVINQALPTDKLSAPVTISYISDDISENVVVAANSGSFEIYASKENKDSYLGGSVYRSSVLSKYININFFEKYNDIFLSNSHKISPYLKNEICTRAP